MQPTRRLSWACGQLALALLSVFALAQGAPTGRRETSGDGSKAAAVSRADHPRHMVKTWLTSYRGRTFRVVQLPRCEHMEALVAYHREGETKEQAKARAGGVAACTGSFHNPRSMALADFYQLDGAILSGATTGRAFLATTQDGRMLLTQDYASLKGLPGVTALALGQRLAPLERDGFSKAFMRQTTDRMALGMNRDYVFIVQAKTDLYRLSEFMQKKLPVRVAVNADGGHVVRGKSPVHIVFRWRDGSSVRRETPELEQLSFYCLPARAEGATCAKPKA